MKFRPLQPWISGNGSVTPKNFYNKVFPNLTLGAFLSLDICVDLYLANTIDSGNLYDSWHKNREYIAAACKITNTGIENDFYLHFEEKQLILKELGEPPECCYNIYLITIYKKGFEKIVYIGKTDSKKSRFNNGHLAALKLHNPKYKTFNKRIYFGTITFLDKQKDYIPLEFIDSFEKASLLLSGMEGFLISHFNPELNVKSETLGEIKELALLHIQNFTGVTNFLNDYFIF